MISLSLQSLRRLAVAIALCATFVGLAASPAAARVFVGIGLGVPFGGFYPPPYYYPPPPPYYGSPPPPVVYAPPPQYPLPQQATGPGDGGQACYAGAYVCPMDHPIAAGGSCYCPGNGGQRVWGRAN
jgi:hypothetical protein